jgi:hypothetical protein
MLACFAPSPWKETGDDVHHRLSSCHHLRCDGDSRLSHQAPDGTSDKQIGMRMGEWFLIVVPSL